MKGLVKESDRGWVCEVSFADPVEWVTAYEASLSHGGIYVPCAGAPPALTDVTVFLRLPAVPTPLELRGNVVHTTPEGMALDLHSDGGRRWAAMKNYATYAAAMIRELTGRRDAPLGPITQRPLPSLEAGPGEGSPHRIVFGSIGDALDAFMHEICLGRLTCAHTPGLNLTHIHTLRYYALPLGRAMDLPANVSAVDDDQLLLTLNLSPQLSARLAASATASLTVWLDIASVVRRREGAQGVKGDEASPQPPPVTEVSPTQAPPPQGLAPPPQGLAPPPQGLVPPPRGLAPSHTAGGASQPSGAHLAHATTLTTGAAAHLPDQREIMSHERGTLAEGSLVARLKGIAAGGRSGFLLVKDGDTQIALHFHRGALYQLMWHPRKPHHRMTQQLIESGRLEAAVVEAVRRKAIQRGCSAGVVLLEEGHLAPSELVDARRHQLEAFLVACLDLTQGQADFYETRPLDESPTGLDIPPMACLFHHLRDRYAALSHREIEAHNEPIQHKWLLIHGDADAPPPELEFTPAEARFWTETLAHSNHLNQVYTKSLVGGLRPTFGTLEALRRLGYFSLHNTQSATSHVADIRDRYKDKLDRAAHATHFDALDLHWGATTDEVEREARDQARAYHHKNAGCELPLDVINMSERIVALIDQARAALATHEARMAYRLTFLNDTQLNFAADLLYQQADADLFKRDLDAAIDRLEHVLEIVPRHAEAKLMLAEAQAKRHAKGG